MSKLNTINLVMGALLIIMAGVGLRETYSAVQKYGWSYTEITIIGEDVIETEVSVRSQIISILLLGSLGIILLKNNQMLGHGYTIDFTPLEEGGLTGITFPMGKPDSWDLGVNLRTQIIDVEINGFMVSFPLSKIHVWIEKHEREKMEDIK